MNEDAIFIPRCKVVEQNVNAEVLESSVLFKASWILIGFYFSIYFMTKDIPGSLFLTPKNLTDAAQFNHKAFRMEYKLSNFSDRNVYGILQMKVIPSIEALANNAKLQPYRCTVHSVDYGPNSTIRKEKDTRFYLQILQNSSWSTLHFARLEDRESILADVLCETGGRPITDNVIFRWEIGSHYADQVACYINLMMFIVLGIATLLWFIWLKESTNSVRVCFMSVLIPASLISHFPLELLIDVRIARLISYTIQCFIFGGFVVFWRLKSIGFDVERGKKSSEFKPIMMSIIMTIGLIMRGMTRELDLYSFPLLSDSSESWKQDFMSRNVVQLITGFTFYTLITEYLDRFDKMESDEQGAFLADNLIAFFAMAMNAYVFMTMSKENRPIENPVTRAVIAVLWDCVTLYELYASRPVNPLDEVQEGFLNADVISDEEGPINV